MRRLIVLSAVGATLFLAACGGDDETTSSSTAAGTSGASGATGLENSGSSSGIETAGDFIAASLPDEIAVVKEVVADNPDECSGVDDAAGEDFQVSVAVSAATVSPDTPISEVVIGECGNQ